MTTLCVNIDHVATVRQARGGDYPSPVEAARYCLDAGAVGITIHLREDRRHIQDRDLRIIAQTVKSRLNLEMAVAEEIVVIAEELRPHQVTLVPERREEVTTEGGLDVVKGMERLKEVTRRLQSKGVVVSFFIDPEPDQIAATAEAGAEFIEFHTGAYANVWPDEKKVRSHLLQLNDGIRSAVDAGLRINGGHGLTYQNVGPIAALPEIEELNIGHSIISRAVFVGLERAVREMKEIMLTAADNALQTQ